MRLKDKVAIVNGATSGIGRAIALAFAQEGAKVTIVGRSKERAEEVAAKIREMDGRECLVALADVTRTEEVNNVVKKTLELFGRIDILVNSAVEIKRLVPVVEMGDEDWEDLNTNLLGYFRFCRAVLKPMLEQNRGKIINISSNMANSGTPGFAHYAAAKGGINGFSAVLAQEVGPYGICVNVLSPGLVETETSMSLMGGRESPLVQDRIKHHALRKLSRPEDQARVAVFLASDDSDLITGHILRVDAGSFPTI